MNYYYFLNCANLDEVKSKYKELVKKYHPDINPSIDIKIIQDLNIEYKYITTTLSVNYPIRNVKGAGYQYQRQSAEDAEQARKKYSEHRAYANHEYKNNYKKPEYTYEKPQDLTTNLDADVSWICRAYVDITLKKHKPSSLVFKYTEYKKATKRECKLEHLELIGRILGYKPAWAKMYMETILTPF